jgi:hypothetical protein
MARVTGIGGVFMKAKTDEKALKEWYVKHLGMPLEPWGGLRIPEGSLDLRHHPHREERIEQSERCPLRALLPIRARQTMRPRPAREIPDAHRLRRRLPRLALLVDMPRCYPHCAPVTIPPSGDEGARELRGAGCLRLARWV